MKKSLVLAMAMALGVTASAYAANPFSDVPAGHWAYDSIDKLAAAGVIDGMGDGTYQGDKTMTRYEMAQIVAKAMAKGANVDKLAAEFADELDNLGVRVANLEKKADNVKITGAINYVYKDGKGIGTASKANGAAHRGMLRSDLTIKGQVNEDWTYTALIRNEQYIEGTAAGKGEETARFQRAWVDGKIGGLKVKAGRYGETYMNGEIWNDRVDGIEVAYGKAVKVTAGYAQLANNHGLADVGTVTQAYGEDAKVMYAEVKAALSKRADIEVDYYKFKDVTTKNIATAAQGDANIYGATLNYKLTKNLGLTATYVRSSEESKNDDDKDGITVKLAYKGANKAKVGSYGLWVKYIDLSDAVTLGDGNYSTPAFVPAKATDGYKGFQVGANYGLAKNIIGTVEYYGLKGKVSNERATTVVGQLTFTF